MHRGKHSAQGFLFSILIKVLIYKQFFLLKKKKNTQKTRQSASLQAQLARKGSLQKLSWSFSLGEHPCRSRAAQEGPPSSQAGPRDGGSNAPQPWEEKIIHSRDSPLWRGGQAPALG